MNTSRFITEFGNYTLPQNDKFIAKAFEEGGHWESGIINMLRKIVDKDFSIINVGSHVGTTLIPLSDFVERIVAFEPQEKLYKLLMVNILNNNKSNIIPIRGVVSNSNKKKVTIKSTDHQGTPINSNSKVNYGGVSIGIGGEEVHSYKIDNLNLGKIHLITIDAEGSEELVISSATETIEKYKPIVLVEQNYLTVTEEMKNSLEIESGINIKEFFRELNYHPAIDLGDSNFLYIHKRQEDLHNKFIDEFGTEWSLYSILDRDIFDNGNDKGRIYYLSENKILVFFSNNVTEVGIVTNEGIQWTNNTNWKNN